MTMLLRLSVLFFISISSISCFLLRFPRPGSDNSFQNCSSPTYLAEYNCPCNSFGQPCKDPNVICIKQSEPVGHNGIFEGLCACRTDAEIFIHGRCQPFNPDLATTNPISEATEMTPVAPSACRTTIIQETQCFTGCSSNLRNASSIPICQALCHNDCLRSGNPVCCQLKPVSIGSVHCCQVRDVLTQTECSKAAVTEYNCFAGCAGQPVSTKDICQRQCKAECLTSSCEECCPAYYPSVCGSGVVSIGDCLVSAAIELDCGDRCSGANSVDLALCQSTCHETCLADTCAFKPETSCDAVNCCPLTVPTFCGDQAISARACFNARNVVAVCIQGCANSNSLTQFICTEKCQASCLGSTCSECCPVTTTGPLCSGTVSVSQCFQAERDEAACFDTNCPSTLDPLPRANCQRNCHSTCSTITCSSCCPRSDPTLCGTLAVNVSQCGVSATTQEACFGACATSPPFQVASCYSSCQTSCLSGTCNDCCPPASIPTFCDPAKEAVTAAECAGAGRDETTCFLDCILTATIPSTLALCQKSCKTQCETTACPDCCPGTINTFCTPKTITGTQCLDARLKEYECYDLCPYPNTVPATNTTALVYASCKRNCRGICIQSACTTCCPAAAPELCDGTIDLNDCNSWAQIETSCYTGCSGIGVVLARCLLTDCQRPCLQLACPDCCPVPVQSVCPAVSVSAPACINADTHEQACFMSCLALGSLPAQRSCEQTCKNVCTNTTCSECCTSIIPTICTPAISVSQCSAAEQKEKECFANNCPATLGPLKRAECQTSCHTECLTSSCAECCPSTLPIVCGSNAISINQCSTASNDQTLCYTTQCTGVVPYQQATCYAGNCQVACLSSTCNDCCPEPPATFCNATSKKVTAYECMYAGSNETSCLASCLQTPAIATALSICQRACKVSCETRTCSECCPGIVNTFCPSQLTGLACLDAGQTECTCYDQCASANTTALVTADCQETCHETCEFTTCTTCCPAALPKLCGNTVTVDDCRNHALGEISCFAGCSGSGFVLASCLITQCYTPCQLTSCDDCCPPPNQIFCGPAEISALACLESGSKENQCATNCQQIVDSVSQAICLNVCKENCEIASCVECCPLVVPTFCASLATGQQCLTRRLEEATCYDQCAQTTTAPSGNTTALVTAQCQRNCHGNCIGITCLTCCPATIPTLCDGTVAIDDCNARALLQASCIAGCTGSGFARASCLFTQCQLPCRDATCDDCCPSLVDVFCGPASVSPSICAEAGLKENNCAANCLTLSEPASQAVCLQVCKDSCVSAACDECCPLAVPQFCTPAKSGTECLSSTLEEANCLDQCAQIIAAPAGNTTALVRAQCERNCQGTCVTSTCAACCPATSPRLCGGAVTVDDCNTQATAQNGCFSGCTGSGFLLAQCLTTQCQAICQQASCDDCCPPPTNIFCAPTTVSALTCVESGLNEEQCAASCQAITEPASQAVCLQVCKDSCEDAACGVCCPLVVPTFCTPTKSGLQCLSSTLEEADCSDQCAQINTASSGNTTALIEAQCQRNCHGACVNSTCAPCCSSTIPTLCDGAVTIDICNSRAVTETSCFSGCNGSGFALANCLTTTCQTPCLQANCDDCCPSPTHTFCGALASAQVCSAAGLREQQCASNCPVTTDLSSRAICLQACKDSCVTASCSECCTIVVPAVCSSTRTGRQCLTATLTEGTCYDTCEQITSSPATNTTELVSANCKRNCHGNCVVSTCAGCCPGTTATLCDGTSSVDACNTRAQTATSCYQGCTGSGYTLANCLANSCQKPCITASCDECCPLPVSTFCSATVTASVCATAGVKEAACAAGCTQTNALEQAICRQACKSSCTTTTCTECCPLAVPVLCGAKAVSVSTCSAAEASLSTCYSNCVSTSPTDPTAQFTCQETCRTNCLTANCGACCPVRQPTTLCGTVATTATVNNCVAKRTTQQTCYTNCNAGTGTSISKLICQISQCRAACITSTCCDCCPQPTQLYCTSTKDAEQCLNAYYQAVACYNVCPAATLASCQFACRNTCVTNSCAACCPLLV